MNENVNEKMISEMSDFLEKFGVVVQKEKYDNTPNKKEKLEGHGIFSDNISISSEGSISVEEPKCCQKEILNKTITSDKVYIFTAGTESNQSPQITELLAKAKTNILGLKKTRVELIDLTGKEIVNEIPDYNYSEVQQGSYKMNYINYNFNYQNAESDFVSAGVSVLEIENKNKLNKLGIVLFAYSYDDDLDNLGKYMTDGLIEIYNAGYSSDYNIVNFHTAVEGFNPKQKYATVLAGLVD